MRLSYWQLSFLLVVGCRPWEGACEKDVFSLPDPEELGHTVCSNGVAPGNPNMGTENPSRSRHDIFTTGRMALIADTCSPEYSSSTSALHSEQALKKMCDECFADMSEPAPKTGSELPQIRALTFPLQLGPACEGSVETSAAKEFQDTSSLDAIVCFCYPNTAG